MSLSQELRSVPNLLSILRLLMVPVFLYLLFIDQFVWALVVMAIASASDWLDGFIARKFNQITQLGQVLDPAADRLFIMAALVGLTVNGNIPAWLAIIIVLRDVMLLAVYPVHGHGHHAGR